MISRSPLKLWLFVILSVSLSARIYARDIAFFYALDRDFQMLSSAAERRAEPVKIGTRAIARLIVGPHRVYAIKMESGLVVTALSAEALLGKFHCDLAFAIGPAGALSDTASIGQWFHANQAIAYQHGAEGESGFALAQSAIIDLPAVSRSDFKVPRLFQAIPDWKVASGEVFVVSDRFRRQVQELTKAPAVDMNLYSLAIACRDHQVPLFCWRIVSDHADQHAATDFKQFVSYYDGAGAQAILELITSLSSGLNEPTAYPALKKLLSQ